MNNSNTTSGVRARQISFDEFVVCGLIFNPILIYLIINQILVFHFGWKSGKLRTKLTDYQLVINVSLITSGLAGFVTIIIESVNFFVPYEYWTLLLMVVLTGLSYFTFYAVLWMRQRLFYTNPNLAHLMTPFSRFYSKFEGLLLIALTLGVWGFVCQQVIEFRCSVSSCLPPHASLIGIIYQFQTKLSMLILFALPLLHHIKDIGTEIRTDSLLYQVKRTAILTLISFLLDIVTTTILIVTRSGNIIYKLKILLNYIFVISIFKDWKRRFLLCRLCNDTVQGNRSKREGDELNELKSNVQVHLMEFTDRGLEEKDPTVCLSTYKI